MKTKLNSLFVLLAMAINLVACSAQVDDQYAGDSLLEVKGQLVTSEGVTPESAYDLYVYWNLHNADAHEISANPARFEGAFPLSFTLGITAEPSDDFLFHDLTDAEGNPIEGGASLGSIVAIPAGMDPLELLQREFTEPLYIGYTEEIFVLYINRDLDAETAGANYIGDGTYAVKKRSLFGSRRRRQRR
ncbi:MAG: hypothetical protein R3A47_03770 [Polyangiales bacterium]